LPSRYHDKVRHLIEIGAPEAAEAPVPVRQGSGLRFLYVGRFLFWKGMQYGLRAFAKLLREVPTARLTMVGAPTRTKKRGAIAGSSRSPLARACRRTCRC
jgi:glycosyltransferase involved in cell wall biosynthesis